jgi:hypothetical protein
MHKERLKELIVEHKDGFLARGDLIPRELQSQIARYLSQRGIIILSGVRRCGRSSLRRLICGDLLENFDFLELKRQAREICLRTISPFALVFLDRPCADKLRGNDVLCSVFNWYRGKDRYWQAGKPAPRVDACRREDNE